MKLYIQSGDSLFSKDNETVTSVKPYPDIDIAKSGLRNHDNKPYADIAKSGLRNRANKLNNKCRNETIYRLTHPPCLHQRMEKKGGTL